MEAIIADDAGHKLVLEFPISSGQARREFVNKIGYPEEMIIPLEVVSFVYKGRKFSCAETISNFNEFVEVINRRMVTVEQLEAFLEQFPNHILYEIEDVAFYDSLQEFAEMLIGSDSVKRASNGIIVENNY